MQGFAGNFLAGHMGARQQMRADEQQQNANALAPLQRQAMQLGMDQTRQGMAIDQERLAMARQASAREAEAFAMRVDAQELARVEAETRAMNQRLIPLYEAGDPEAFNAAAAQLGAQITFDEFPVDIAADEAAFEVWDRLRKMKAGPEQPATPAAFQALEMRAQAAGFQPGTPEYQQFMATGGREAPVLNVGADGSVFSGPASAAPKFTEGQSKDNVYATRAEGALALLDSVGAGELTSRQDRILGAVPLGIGREAQSEDFQVAEQAGEEFLQAILRKDTGAAITSQEQDLYGKTYLPQPGDGPRVIEAKRAARIRALEAIKAGMSVQQVTVQQRALVNAARGAAEGQPDIPDQPPEYLDELDADLWSDYTPDQRQIILRAYEGQR